MVDAKPEAKPEASGLPATAAPRVPPAGPVPRPKRRRLLRLVLLVLVPLLAAGGGFAFWLAGGRWISTDNSYIGAEKILVTPDVSGRVVSIAVREGQHVAEGDALFEIDPSSYRLALAEAEAKLAAAKAEYATLKTAVDSLGRQIVFAEESLELRQKDLERKLSLLGNRVATQSDVETVRIAVASARAQIEMLRQQRATALDKLLGSLDTPLEAYPAYRQAETDRDKAARDLAHTRLTSPIDGIATQVPSIQMGRYLTAGTTVFAIVANDRPWVDANPKETDLEHVRVGQPVEIRIDAYPDRVLAGTVEAISPGTGAQFSILPPQNASGNWVKVVQRVPLRIAFAPGQNLAGLRAGMSADVAIDTGRQRSLASLLGLSAYAQVQPWIPAFARAEPAVRQAKP